jgi:hypothetical protein
MNLQRIYISITTVVAVSCFAGCTKNFMDTRIDTQQTEETLNSNYSTLFSLANAPYINLRNEFSILDNNLFAPASDEAVQTATNASVRLFNNGSWNANNNPDDYYYAYYTGIKAANYFIEQSGNYKSFLALNRDTFSLTGKDNYRKDTLNIKWYRAEAHILRALYYFELTKRYGGVPFVTRSLDITDNSNLPVTAYEAITDFIVNEVDTNKDSLQRNWRTSEFTSNEGRLTLGAALALKARALLYAASPLHNPTNDAAKWQKAAAALRDVVVFAQGAGAYSLHTDYKNYFLETNTLTSNETIWAIRYQANNTLEKNNYPITTVGGASGITPTDDLVADYETITGAPVDPANPYANRDPRLAYTIVTNNSSWNSRTIDQSPGATDDMAKANTSRTGYYLKKFLVDALNLTQGTTKTHNWPVFRYGEILLEYAEAMNEAYGPDNSNGYPYTARQALNMVRGRAGVAMSPVTVTDPGVFRTAVKHERRIELAFENHRYWDLIRWKDAGTVLNQPVHGVKVTRNGAAFVYTGFVVENRVFDASKMYYYPFAQTEIIKSQGVLKQNLNW